MHYTNPLVRVQSSYIVHVSKTKAFEMAKTVDLEYLEAIQDGPISEGDYTDYTYNDVIYCRGAKSYVLTVGTHKQTGNTAVSHYYHVGLCEALEKACPYAGHGKIVTGKATAQVQVYEPKAVRQLSRLLACLQKFPICDAKGAVDVSAVLAILRWIPGMSHVPLAYLQSLDGGVTVMPDSSKIVLLMCEKEIAQFDSDEPMGRYYIHTSAVMICAAYAVLLMIVKTINPNAAGQMDLFLESRLRALCHTLGIEAKSITWTNTIRPLFDVTHLMKLNNEVGFFPRLKKTVFIPVLDKYTPELQHMYSIFQDSSMTIFSLIAEFWLTTDVTRLHVCPTVLIDLPEWQRAMDTLVSTYGCSWKFYKLIDPKGTLTATSNFRTLGCAALSWKRINAAQTGQLSLNQLQGVRANPEFEKLAAMKLKPEFVGKGAKSYVALLKNLLSNQSTSVSVNWSRVIQAIESGEWVEGRDF